MLRLARGAADAIGVLFFAAVFAAINIQVFMRYVANRPVGWGEELPTLAFTVATLWATSFCLSARDHIVFDLVHEAAPPALRRAMALASAAFVAGTMGLAFPAILDFALYMKVLSTPILRIRLDFVFSFFALLVGALAASACLDMLRALRPPPARAD